MAMFPIKIGLSVPDALAWTELSKTATNYTEATLSVGATLQAGDSFGLGVVSGFSCDDITFTYVDSATGGSFEGVCPEPASMALLALGGLATLRRRRR